MTHPLNSMRKTIQTHHHPQPHTLYTYIARQIATLEHYGQHRTAETYRSTLNSFRNFRQGKDLSLKEIDTPLLTDYAFFLKTRKGLAHNTVMFYLKRLRAIYNKAVEEGWTEDRHPFRKISTASEKTAKRAILIKDIQQLKDLDLSGHPVRCFARDIFLFSFCTRGMSFIDIALLRKTDLQNDTLKYHRKKTGQTLSMHWEPWMQRIAEKHESAPDSPYLLSIIRNPEGDIRKQCHTALTLINRHLKEIGKILGLPAPLTMHVARHSWASIAHNEGIPLSVISEGLGHESEKTTRIYLASLESRIIDNANQQILRKLL